MSQGGAERSENVGTSNRNPDAISGHRKPKVSLAMIINQGLGGPKEKPKGVSDGQPVNIPAHSLNNLKMTESSTLSVLLDLRLFYEVFQVGQKFLSSEGEIQKSTLPRKVLSILFNGFRTVNQHR